MNQTNIFVILAEDICPNLGCYGDKNAKTPIIDKFAKENIRFQQCYSVAPVCSAARTSLNLGVFSPTAGVGHHRSENHIPDFMKNIGESMQECGYYTMISKTDFNFKSPKGYDVQYQTLFKDTADFAKQAVDTIDEAPKGKPIFMLHTSGITHQSQYGFTNEREVHRTTIPRLEEREWQERDSVTVPKYHFDTEESREIWCQYYEKLSAFDRMFGELLQGLHERKLYEDSIIIVIGDNGHGIPSGKCNLWNEGVHVPCLLHLPKELEGQLELQEDEYGRYSSRLLSFLDFYPSFLSLLQKPIPTHLQGTAFLGEARKEEPKYIFSFSQRVDEVGENSRSIHTKDSFYCCDFALTPYRRLNTYQITQAPWFVRSMIEAGYDAQISDRERRALFRQMPRNLEEYYHVAKDKNQLHNLAEECKEDVTKLREVLFDFMESNYDDAFMPEALMKAYVFETGKTPYDILHDSEIYPLSRLIALYRAGITGESLPSSVKTPCEKVLVTKFLADRGEGSELLQTFCNDQQEIVKAYACYRCENWEGLLEVSKKTENPHLCLLILDMITVVSSSKALPCFQVLLQRHQLENVFAPTLEKRYEAALHAGFNMVRARYGLPLPKELDEKFYWKSELFDKAALVLTALKC